MHVRSKGLVVCDCLNFWLEREEAFETFTVALKGRAPLSENHGSCMHHALCDIPYNTMFSSLIEGIEYSGMRNAVDRFGSFQREKGSDRQVKKAAVPPVRLRFS